LRPSPAAPAGPAGYEAKISPDKDIPHVSAPIIVKNNTDRLLPGLL
jgi:hypothetical protein